MNVLFERALSAGKISLQKKYKHTKDPYVKNYGKEVARDEMITGIPLALVGVNSLLSAKKRKQIHESLAATIIKPLASAVGHAAVKQGITWGVGGALATKLTQDKNTKDMTPEEKKKARMNLLKSGLAGSAAGAIGSAI